MSDEIPRFPSEIAPTESVSEKTKKENLFPGFFSEQQFKKFVENSVALIREHFQGFNLADLDSFEDAYWRVEKPGAVDVECRHYISWRERFGSGEIREMVQAAHSGGLKEVLIDKLSQEIDRIETITNQPTFRENMDKAKRGIRSFFEESKIKLPDGFDFDRNRFMGPYAEMMIQSVESGGCEPVDFLGGEYLPALNSTVVYLKKEGMEGKHEQVFHVYVHETFHRASEKGFEVDEDTEFLDFNSLKISRVGFLSMRKGSRRSQVFNSLNEGATEYFARRVSERKGFTIKSIDGENLYGADLDDVSALINFLSKGDPVVDADQQQVDSFLQQYTEGGGLLSLGREMDKKVGPHALALFECLSSFRDFLIALIAMRMGESQIPKIKIKEDRLKKYGLKPEEVQKIYPFVSVGTYVSDDRGVRSCVWK